MVRTAGEKFVTVLSRCVLPFLVGTFQALIGLTIVGQLGAECFQPLVGFLLLCRVQFISSHRGVVIDGSGEGGQGG